MGLFNRKEEIPTIPPAPSLPSIPPQVIPQQEKKDLPELPSFPSNSKNENFNQEMVKSAITDLPSSEGNGVTPRFEKNAFGGETFPPMRSVEVSKPEINIPTYKGSTLSNMGSPSSLSEESKLSLPKPKETIFVRIDKFKNVQKNLTQIKDKIQEVESVLKKIQSVKLQEDNELKGWSENVEKIKSRLTEVDTSFFDQI